jgi:adenine-specific DNA-methyltransferase
MIFESIPKVNDSFKKSYELVVLNNSVEAALLDIPKNLISLIISSPPYNIGKVYEKQVSLDEYLKWQKEVIKNLVDRLTPTGSICWQVGNYIENGEVFPLDIYFYRIFKELGLQLRNRIIWHFDHGLHAKNRCSGRYETILWFTKSKDYVFNLDPIRIPSKYPGKLNYKGKNKGLPSGNPLGKNPSDFWVARTNEWENGIFEIPNVKANHPEKTMHPCQFPVELVERCILALTNENDWVLDPFGGVGTVLIASTKHKRKAISIDKEKEYCKLAAQRVIDFYEGRLNIRPIGKPVHQPSGREKVSQIPELWNQIEERKK